MKKKKPEPDVITIQDARMTQYYRKNNLIVDQYTAIIGVHAALVYDILCRYGNRTREAETSIRRMAERLGISERSVKRGVATLKYHSIIQVIRKVNEKTRRYQGNIYRLIDIRHWVK